MKFLNTNDILSGKKELPSWTLSEVLLKGQAPDKGLFIPERFVFYSPETIKNLKNKTYAEVAYEILKPYFDDINDKDFKEIIEKAYNNFKAPVIEIEHGIYALELFHNNTFAFKDFAAQLLAATIEYILKEKNIKIAVFVGTSGDTGPAIVESFYNKKNITVFCLFPEKGVTEIQRKQMTTLGNNIIPIAVDGDFHDCQEMAKSALDDKEMKRFNPTSANSINWCRFIPQAVFSFWFYSRVAQFPEEVVLCIPTGNGGHLGANLLARKNTGGLPVAKFIAPHNKNNYLVRMIESGKTSVEILPTFECLSNAMNVRFPNNIPRILSIYNSDISVMASEIWPVTITDEKTAETIKKIYKKTGMILDVHSAVAYAGAMEFLEKNPSFRNYKTGIFFTAHPAKFPEKIEKILGFKPPLPNKLKEQLEKKECNLKRLKAGDKKTLLKIVNEYMS